MNGSLHDFRYSLRQLRKKPGFSAVAVITLALGIGANAAIFSVIESVLLRPLPFRQPDRLVWLNGRMPLGDEAAVSPPDFRDYRASNRTFDCIAAMGYATSPSNLSGDKAEQILASIASARFFECLGIPLLLGRDFALPDEQANEPQVAILGYGLWKRDFGGDRSIVGRTVRIDGLNRTVVGVLASDVPLLSEAQLWLPTPMLNAGMNVRLGHSLKAIGRLKPGVTLQQSQTDLDAIALQLQHQYADTNKGWWMRQRPLGDVLVGAVRPALLLIWGAVGLVLLIACVNVANLLLAQFIARGKEFALRAALGASRARMFRQGIAESITLSFLGGVLGVLAAALAAHALRALGSLDIPRLEESRINPAVLGFTAGISLFTAFIFGLVPAWQSSGGAFLERLKESGRTSTPTSHKRLRGALVIGEIAMSLTLLVSAGLLLKSFWRLIHVNPGFRTDHVVTARLSLPFPSYDDARARVRFWQQFERRVKTLPGVETVGAISELPLTGEPNDDPFYLPGRVYGPSEFDDAQLRQATVGYLSAMQIPLITGRWFNEQDNGDAAGVVVVNRAFVKRFFPAGDMLGKRIRLMGDPQTTREVVGVINDVHHFALSEPGLPEMYVPYAQFAAPTMNVVLRAAANPLNLAAALQAQASSVDKDITLSEVTPMDDVLDASLSQPRFSAELIGTFAALALLLAAIGLYGLVAYSVSQRKNEIAIRMALGATRGEILSMVLRHGSALALAGIAIGLAASIAAARLFTSMLFAVSPNDPQTFLAIALLLTAVALGASYLPARRAAAVDPMVALRYE